MSIFYRPDDGYVGDVIPFYWEGQYHAFYLKAPLPPLRHGADHTPYAHVVSADLTYWEERPLAIEPGDNAALKYATPTFSQSRPLRGSDPKEM